MRSPSIFYYSTATVLFDIFNKLDTDNTYALSWGSVKDISSFLIYYISFSNQLAVMVLAWDFVFLTFVTGLSHMVHMLECEVIVRDTI